MVGADLSRTGSIVRIVCTCGTEGILVGNFRRLSKGVQPNGSHYANINCSTQYEQSFQHNKHKHTNKKAATDQDSPYNHNTHHKIHQGMQSLHNIQKPHIHTTSV